MADQQPEALRLADSIEKAMRPEASLPLGDWARIAAELRRLSAVEAERDALLKALHNISLASQDSGSTREGMGLYARAAIDALAIASLRASLPSVVKRLAELEQQAEPVQQQKRKDGSYKVLYRCKDCGYEQLITEVVKNGMTSVGGSANWCDRCETGLPVRAISEGGSNG